jgi:hypothetical protein
VEKGFRRRGRGDLGLLWAAWRLLQGDWSTDDREPCTFIGGCFKQNVKKTIET